MNANGTIEAQPGHHAAAMRSGRVASAAAALALAFLSATPSFAQETPGAGRYEMHPSGAGVLRLDRVTGEIALCAEEDAGGDWTCRPAVAASSTPPQSTPAPSASGAAPRAELERLRQENARLTARVDELERRLAHVDALAGSAVGPTDAETDEAIADIDRAVRVGIYAISRFRDIAEALASDEGAQPR